MGIFSDNVRKYFEHGLVTIPCKDKRPILGKEWQRFCEVAPTEEMIDKWESSYQDATQLGLTLGKATLLSGFDFDYEFNEKKCGLKESEFVKDRKNIERQIIALLPPTPCIKTGKKGWTRIYRSHGDLDNAQADRHGLRLFDFLARNKQTIIPPSKYSDDTDFSYRWIGSPIEDCLSEIPFITRDIVEEIRFVTSGIKKGYDFEGNGRHGMLLKWLVQVARVEPDVKKVVSELIARDIRLHPIPYLSDHKHFPANKSAETNALEWVTRIRKFNEAIAKDIPPVGAEGWDYFFENSFSKIRKDVITKKCFFKLRPQSEWGMMDDVEPVLRSYADKRGLQSPKTVDELARWTLEKEDSDFLCDIPKWDGIDRVSLFGMAIHSPDFTGDEISEILKHWGSNIFRRVRSAENQNRCVILKGPQGIGKDFLVRAMLKEFKPYYESTTMPGTQKDALEICSRLLAVHIEEFDQTKNIDVAFLKSLITQPSAFFRESYGASPNQKIMRPSFISTANVDDILRDPTGNRRFVVVPVESISWEYPVDQSLMVLAQWRAHSEAGEFVSLSEALEAKIRALVDAYTPDDLSVAILDLYRSRYDELWKKYGSVGMGGHLTGVHVTPMLADIARMLQCGIRKVQGSVRGAALSHHSRDGARYYRNRDDAARSAAAASKIAKRDETVSDVF